MQGSDGPKYILSLTNCCQQNATNQGQSEGGKTECARDLANRVFPDRWRMRKVFVHGGCKKTISTLNFSKPSRTTWVQLLRIVRENKDETVIIFSNKSYGQFFSHYEKRQNFTFLTFTKILSIAFFSLSLSLKTIIYKYFFFLKVLFFISTK